MPNRFFSFLGCILLAGICYRYWDRQEEDFVYYYCTGQVWNQQASPYDPKVYQECVEKFLESPNPNVSKSFGSAYPPSTLGLFGILAQIPYRQAFYAWNALLALASAAILRFFSLSVYPYGPLLVLWPGFILGWGYHKISLILFPLALWGIRISQERQTAGGLLLGLTSIQPQWFLCLNLFLALHKRWRALAVSLTLGLFPFLLYAESSNILMQWLVNLTHHSTWAISLDNQSLFISLYKPLQSLAPQPIFWLQAIRYGLSTLLVAGACFLTRGRSMESSMDVYLALWLLAQPYSHGSDSLWAFPLFLQVLDRTSRNLGGNLWKAALAGLSWELGLAFLFQGYAPSHLARTSHQNLQGYIGCLVAAVYAGLNMLNSTSSHLRKKQ